MQRIVLAALLFCVVACSPKNGADPSPQASAANVFQSPCAPGSLTAELPLDHIFASDFSNWKSCDEEDKRALAVFEIREFSNQPENETVWVDAALVCVNDRIEHPHPVLDSGPVRWLVSECAEKTVLRHIYLPRAVSAAKATDWLTFDQRRRLEIVDDALQGALIDFFIFDKRLNLKPEAMFARVIAAKADGELNALTELCVRWNALLADPNDIIATHLDNCVARVVAGDWPHIGFTDAVTEIFSDAATTAEANHVYREAEQILKARRAKGTEL